ncbi:hypothetical protein ADUPG1_007426 [Aduncisulcus paluster]|uniref:Uncharacterized protein n=1 Tax=Aduncisulcus paluster TaxID=2918883 RepID=A0ABQ5KM18_9EUKA|nr:hypothetical protein ADUPG1_007426 [Aduncisulcus paluster]
MEPSGSALLASPHRLSSEQPPNSLFSPLTEPTLSLSGRSSIFSFYLSACGNLVCVWRKGRWGKWKIEIVWGRECSDISINPMTISHISARYGKKIIYIICTTMEGKMVLIAGYPESGWSSRLLIS